MTEPEDQDPRDAERAPRPGRFRVWVLRPLLWLLALLVLLGAVAYFALESEPVRQRVEAFAEDRLSRALGDREVTFDHLDLQPFALTARVTGLTIASDDPGEPPLLSARWAEVEVDLTELRSASILRLERIEVMRPDVFLELYDDGGTNLPDFQRDGGGGRFEVILDHLLVHEGLVRLEDRNLPLSVDARQVRARMVGGGVLETKNTFDIGGHADAVEVVLPNAEPLTVRLEVAATVQPGRLELDRVRATRQDLDAEATGTVTWGEETSARLDVEARGRASLVRELGWMDEPVSGPVAFEGDVAWTPEAWSWQGRVRSEGIDTFGRSFEAVTARVRGDSREVTVEIEGARHAGGSLTGTVRVDMEALPSGARQVRLDADGRSMHLRRLLDDLELPLEGLAGRVDADLAYRFTTDGVLEGEGSGELRVAELRRPTDRLEVSGRSDVALGDGVLRFGGVVLDARDQHVEADASFDLVRRTGRGSYRIGTRDLERLFLLAPGAQVEMEEGAEPAAWVPRRGEGTLEGTFTLGSGGFSTDVAFGLADVAIPGLAVDTLEGSLRYADDGLRDLDATATVGDGRFTLNGFVGLPGEVDLASEIESLPARTLEGLLPAGLTAQGDLFGDLRLTGTFESLELRGSLRSAPLQVAGFAFDRAEASFTYDDGVLALTPLDLSVPAGGATVSGTVDFRDRTLDLSARAQDLALSRPPLAGYGAADLDGVVDATVELTGPFENPDGRVDLTARELTLAGRPLGDGVARVEASLAGRRLEAEGSLLELVDFDGGGTLDGEAVDLSFQVSSSRLRRILELTMESPPELEGGFAGTLGVTGDPRRLQETVNARLELSSLSLRFQDRTIENLEPVVAELTPEALFLRSIFLGGTEGTSELFVGGRIDLEPEVPLDLQVQASLDAAWVELLLPDLPVDLDGTFDLLATVGGTLEAPSLNGQGEVRQGQAIVPGFPHALEEVSAVVLLYPDQVVLDSLRGRLAGGRVRAAGRLDVPEPDEPLRYRLQAQAEELTVRWPEGWLVRGGAEMTLEAPVGEGRELRGVVELERAFYLRDVEVGLLSLFQRFFERQRLDVRETDETLASTQLALSVEGRDALRIRNNLADLTGDVDLTIRGTLARPVVFGQVEVDAGGELVLRDTEYEVERGLLTFSNPYRLDPVLDLVATTGVSGYDVRLNLSGTLDNLRTSFQSDPPLSDLEVLQLLATGSTQGLQPGTGGEEGAFAEQFLLGQATSALSKRVTTLFGFDKFRISPGSGEEGLSAVGVVVEKRISGDLYVAYTSNPAQSEESLLQIGWEVSDQVTLIFSREDEDLALDVRWETVF